MDDIYTRYLNHLSDLGLLGESEQLSKIDLDAAHVKLAWDCDFSIPLTYVACSILDSRLVNGLMAIICRAWGLPSLLGMHNWQASSAGHGSACPNLHMQK